MHYGQIPYFQFLNLLDHIFGLQQSFILFILFILFFSSFRMMKAIIACTLRISCLEHPQLLQKNGTVLIFIWCQVESCL